MLKPKISVFLGQYGRYFCSKWPHFDRNFDRKLPKTEKKFQTEKFGIFGKYFENNQFKLPLLCSRTCSSKIRSSLFLLRFLFSFDFPNFLNFWQKKTRFFYFRILVEFFVRVGWIKILVRSNRFGLAEWKREKKWGVQMVLECQIRNPTDYPKRDKRPIILSDTVASPIYCTMVLCSGKQTNSHNIQWGYWLDSG